MLKVSNGLSYNRPETNLIFDEKINFWMCNALRTTADDSGYLGFLLNCFDVIFISFDKGNVCSGSNYFRICQDCE